MIPSRRPRYLSIFLLTASLSSFGQAVPWLETLPATGSLEPQSLAPASAATNSNDMAPQVATTTAPSAVTVPAGTRVIMVLESPLHTTSGTAGSGIYLRTLFPVIQENRIVIPAHTQVLGTVESNRRPGHLNRTSEFGFRFTSLILANNHVESISGVLQSIPGARTVRTKDKKGTLTTVDQVEKVIIPAAGYSVGGAILGSVSRTGVGKFAGAGLGAALGLGSMLLKRGDEINLPQGSRVEMVLAAPLTLDRAQIEAAMRASPQQFMAGPMNGAQPPMPRENHGRPGPQNERFPELLRF